jgi:hypothetical protein
MAEENDAKKNPRELKLASGQTICVNLNSVVLQEVIEYVNIKFPLYEPEDSTLDNKAQEARAKRMTDREAGMLKVAEFRARVSGLTPDQVRKLGYEDYAVLGRKITDLITDPLGADPN